MTLIVSSTLSLHAFGFSWPGGGIIPDPLTCGEGYLNITYTVSKFELDQSQKALQMSENLKIASENINSLEGINKDYLLAMLALADDIGEMADRIGVMADRIVETEVLIGEMGDRIVEVAGMIIDNNAQTQQNILEAQENFNDLILALGQ